MPRPVGPSRSVVTISDLDEPCRLENWQEFEGLEITARIALLLVMLGAAQQALPAIEQLLANPGLAALVLASILERLHRLDEAHAMTECLGLTDRSLDNPERMMLSGILADRAGQHEMAFRHLSLVMQNQTEFVHRHHVLFPIANVCDGWGATRRHTLRPKKLHRSQHAFLEIVMGKSSAEELQIVARSSPRTSRRRCAN